MVADQPGPSRQRAIYIGGIGGKKPAVPVTPAVLESSAEQAMSPAAWAYVAGGAGTGGTVRANREAFEKWRIVPRMLRDNSSRDMSVELFGTRLSSPLLAAPVGALELVHADADIAVARACRAHSVPMIISSQASVPMEDCARELGSTPGWFQLYWSTSNDLVESFVHRAESSGCAAIVLTLDTTMLGWRTSDLDIASLPFLRGMGIAQYTSDPVFRKMVDSSPGAASPSPSMSLRTLGAVPGVMRRARRAGLSLERFRIAIRLFTAIYSRPSLTWSDLPFLRGLTNLPIVLKGIQHPDDARRAIDAGVNGLIVSNHGGRQVDGAIASLDALPPVVAAVADRIPVLFDSGIRCGADAFKAIALGAKAVLIGRPYVYGLAVAGEKGAGEVLANFIAELDLTLGLAGHSSFGRLAGALEQDRR